MTNRVVSQLALFRPHVSPEAFLFVIFLGFILLANAVWLSVDHRPPVWDFAENVLLAEIAYERFVTFDWGSLLSSDYGVRPNFVPFLSALTFPIVGRDDKTTIFIQNAVSLAITSVCIYGIGRRLLDRPAALV